ncbi:MAG: peptidase MA family metallohydrolase [Thermoanaerobaculia bacterium]
MSRSALPSKILALSLLLSGPCLAAAAKGAAPGPRPLTEAERQAVQLAAEYLDRGPEAWWDRLSSGAPLRRLGREAALAEIEVRAGSPAGAEWELEASAPDVANRGAVFALGFPSGVDDTLVLGLVREGVAWKIDSLRILAEPAPVPPAADADAPQAMASKDPEPAPEPPAPPSKLAVFLSTLPSWVFLATGGAGLLLLIAAWSERKARTMAVSLGVVGGLIVAGAAAGSFLARSQPAAMAGAGEGKDGPPELRRLLPLRRALTQADGVVPSTAPPETQAQGTAGQVAKLWWAQHLLGGTDQRGVDALLKDFPSPGRIPLAELLRARAAFLRLQEVPTASAYQRATAVGVIHESLLSESAQAFLLLGFDSHAKEFLEQLRQLGARQASSWYALAEVAVMDDQLIKARDDFRVAWRLEPKPRSEILEEPLLAAILEDFEIRRLIRMGDSEDPVSPCAAASQRAIPLPAGFEARLLGETLRLSRGEARLRVPGGCDLAPAGTSSDHAGAWNDERERELLERLPALTRTARAPGSLAQPSLRRRIVDTAEALADRRRWTDLLALTDNLSGDLSSVPPDLVRLRAVSLRRSNRGREARDLLIGLAKGNTANRRTDPETLYELSTLLAEEGNYEPAIKLVAKANSQLPFDAGGDRIRQLQMEKRLTISSDIHQSAHFSVVYPRAREKQFAAKAAGILEAERQRLQAWIPVAPSPRPLEVRLLPFEDFRMGFSPGLDVLGLYDGKIRVPLGDVSRFNNFAVSLMTHELAHALITDKTGDRAPRWLQEGLAQHVEMDQAEYVNPIHGYRLKETLVSFPLLESAVGSLSPALVAIGYDESRWAVHYIEYRYGKAGIQRLLNAYRDGQTTPEAIQSALGLPINQFDRELWEWGINKAPAVWKVDVVEYDPKKNEF